MAVPLKPASRHSDCAFVAMTLSRLTTVHIWGVGSGVGVGGGVGVAAGSGVGVGVAAGSGVGVGDGVAVGAGVTVGSADTAGTPSMLPLRIGNADEAVTGIGLPVSTQIIGVMRSNWQSSATSAGAPIPVPSGKVGSGTGVTSVQLISAASVVTSRAYSAWTARL